MPGPTSANPIQALQASPPVVARAAVIGAGVMGSGIAAQFANAGVPVVLLDIAAAEGDPRAIARAGVANQLKAGGFMRPDAAELVIPGSIEHDLPLIADAQWIVEAVVERLEVKQELYRKLETVRLVGSIVSSNTSTLPRSRLVEGMPPGFARDFLITHFFNPPRHMRLVEVVGGPQTPAAHLDRARRAADLQLGKTVVTCRDTPGFIANRIGCYWMAMAAIEALDAALDIEDADAALSAVMGVPRTGVFGLFDLVGIDLVPQVWGSLNQALPAEDDLQRYDLSSSAVFGDMLANGRFGRKAKAGFYRQAADRSREAWACGPGAYRPAHEPDAALKRVADPAAFCEQDGPLSRYARRAAALTIAYASACAPEIADDVRAIDDAMALGYAWSRGPFALADRLGVERVAAWLEREGRPCPALLQAAARRGGFYQDEGRAWLVSTGEAAVSDAARLPPVMGATLIDAESAALWDMGEGVGCFELRTKLNVMSADALDALEKALELARGRFAALVLTGAGERAFSAGADLGLFAARLQAQDWASVEAFQRRGASLYRMLQNSPIPVVAAVFGLALGGGCEASMHCAQVMAHAELTAGLPEAKVGLIPAWGGCTQLMRRAQAEGMDGAAQRVFDTIRGAALSGSALQAQAMGLLRASDRIVMNRDRLLGEARNCALRLAAGGRPLPPPPVIAAGRAARDALIARAAEDPQASAFDRAIAEDLAFVLAGGEAPAGSEVDDETMATLEREALMALVRRPETLARVEHMLATGKPLRN